MALDRTNMVSMLDIGSLMGGKTEKIVEMGNGFSELTEDWGPSTDQKQYVNMKNASNTVKGYAFSMSPEREHVSDEVQTAINEMFKKFPTGAECETHYYRFYKTDITGKSGDCIRIPVTVCPSSTGGAGGDSLTSSFQINGNGDVEVGTVTIGDGSFTWAPKVSTSSS
ncbi:MAG: hypothetical protein PUB19_10265 [Lachnospiraceae bacterium]|nr:hypothetical protein [Lachnospiraceae bacterium]